MKKTGKNSKVKDSSGNTVNRKEEKEKSMTSRIGKSLCDAAGLVLLTGACAGTGALVGAAGHFYKYALTPKKHDPRLDSKPLEKEYAAGRKWMKTHSMREDIYIRSDDGLHLHGNYIPAETARHYYAICVHGYANAADSVGLYASVYRDRYGMNVLLPDLRGHGRSDGNYVGMGYDDSRDILRWIDWILEKDPAARIILHGISMGAATVLMTTGYNLPKQVVAAVSDSSYTSAVDVLTFAYKKEDAAVVPAPVMLEALRAIALVQAGYDIRKAAPIQAVAHSKTPTLFIHGQADGLVPPRMMPALYKAASCEKAFLWIPEADHVQSVNVDPETYWARVERFLHAHVIPLM